MNQEQKRDYLDRLDQLAIGLVKSVSSTMIRQCGTDDVGPADVIAVLTLAKARAQKAYDMAGADAVAHFAKQPEILAGGEALLAAERELMAWAEAAAAVILGGGS